MATDRQLSPNFWLHEFPCWERATEAEVARLTQTVALVLQPARNRWGALRPSSWRYWSDGCIPRTGAHEDPGTVDVVPLAASVEDVFAWIARAIVPLGYVGRLINERDHVHVQPRTPGMEVQVLREPTEGHYVSAPDVLPEGWSSPVPIPGIDVAIASLGGAGWWGLVIGIGLLMAAARGHK